MLLDSRDCRLLSTRGFSMLRLSTLTDSFSHTSSIFLSTFILLWTTGADRASGVSARTPGLQDPNETSRKVSGHPPYLPGPERERWKAGREHHYSWCLCAGRESSGIGIASQIEADQGSCRRRPREEDGWESELYNRKNMQAKRRSRHPLNQSPRRTPRTRTVEPTCPCFRHCSPESWQCP